MTFPLFRHPELVSGSIFEPESAAASAAPPWMLKQVQHVDGAGTGVAQRFEGFAQRRRGAEGSGPCIALAFRTFSQAEPVCTALGLQIPSNSGLVTP